MKVDIHRIYISIFYAAVSAYILGYCCHTFILYFVSVNLACILLCWCEYLL